MIAAERGSICLETVGSHRIASPPIERLLRSLDCVGLERADWRYRVLSRPASGPDLLRVLSVAACKECVDSERRQKVERLHLLPIGLACVPSIEPPQQFGC